MAGGKQNSFRLLLEPLDADGHPPLAVAAFQRAGDSHEIRRYVERLVYHAQTEDAALQEKAKRPAETQCLAYEYRFTGYGELTGFMNRAAEE